jgi:GNAT superfamily N-acetyltransferase
MTTTKLTIERATLADADQLAQTIAQAFHDLAPCQWLVEDPAIRARIFPAFFGLYAELGLRSGTVLTTPDRQAVAIWLPVRPNAIPVLPDHDKRLAAITGPRADRFHTFDELLDEHHPAEPTHEWLAILAVHPTLQYQGIGSALLSHHHALLDHDGTPAYLEAAEPTLCPLYRRHGYKELGEPIQLPAGPQLFPMWREPNPTNGQQ